MKLNALLFITSLLFSSLSLAASNNGQITAQQRWLDAKWIELTIHDNQNDWQGNWRIAFDHPTNSLRIDKDDHFNGQRLKGSLIVINGETLLIKDLHLQPGYEIDALDTPVLMTQLLLTLLDKTVDTSPASLTTQYSIEHHEAIMPVRVATKSASAFFKAPWSVHGTLNKTTNQNIEYKLDFQTTLGDDINYIVSMAGFLNHKKTMKLNNEMSVSDWTIYTLGPDKERQFSYGASKINSSATTLGELRQQLDN